MKKTQVLENVLHANHLNITQFAEICETTPQVVHGWKTRGISQKGAQKIKEKFPKYNFMWLLTGEGEPFDGAAVVPAAAPAVPASTAADGEQYKALFAELVAQRKMFEGQISRLLELLENLSKKISGETTAE